MSFAKNLLSSSLLVGTTAAIGSAVTDPDTLWYKLLKKPDIQPPKAAFPIAWTALYGLMAVASAKAITTGEKTAETQVDYVDIDLSKVDEATSERKVKKALKKALKDTDKEWDDQVAHTREGKKVRAYKRALVLNLILNAGWSALFWQGRNLKIATVEAAALAVSSADLVRRAGQLDTSAGVLLLPYVGWTAFATALTASIDVEN